MKTSAAGVLRLGKGVPGALCGEERGQQWQQRSSFPDAAADFSSVVPFGACIEGVVLGQVSELGPPLWLWAQLLLPDPQPSVSGSQTCPQAAGCQWWVSPTRTFGF